MKKFLNIFFAAVLISVSAQSLYAADLKVNGEYRVRGYNYNTVTGIDRGDGADYLDQRFLLTGTVAQGMTSGVVELQLLELSNGQGGSIWGSAGNGGYGNINGNIGHGGVHQAYLNVTFPMANLMAGRRIIKLGHGLILNDTADNLALNIPLQILSVDLAYLKLGETDSVNGGTTGCGATCNKDMDHSGYLVNVGLKPIESWSLGAFYVTDSQKNPGATDNTTQNVIGISADGQAGPLGILFEYDNIGGTAAPGRSFKGQNILAAVTGDVAVAKVGIGYLRVTGKDASSTDVSSNSLSGDFVGGHGILFNDQTRYGGGVNFNKSVSDSGLASFVTSLGANPAGLNENFYALKLFGETMPLEGLNVGIEIYPLVQLVDSAVLFGSGPGSPTDTNIGQEYNIYGGYKLDKNLSLTAVIAYFNTSDVIKDIATFAGAPGSKNATKLNAALTYTF